MQADNDLRKEPRVSVVVATFHRPQVLHQALQSLQAQTFTDWEAVVVGDACTDGTEEVVAGFQDRRLRWHNLESNVGNQYGPNNTGVGLARAPLVAFLNHDDLWFPDHLQRSVEELVGSGADLVFSLLAAMRPDGRCSMLGATSTGGYDPRVGVPASAWLFQRQLFERVGPWRAPERLHTIPSQDWLFRAWRSGAVMRACQHLGVVAVQSGGRPGCYRDPGAAEHEQWLRQMREHHGWREQLLTQAFMEEAGRARQAGMTRRCYELALGGWFALAARLGCHPDGLRNALKHGRKGGLVRRLRTVRGLEGSGVADKTYFETQPKTRSLNDVRK
jgi:hypothetical protein